MRASTLSAVYTNKRKTLLRILQMMNRSENFISKGISWLCVIVFITFASTLPPQTIARNLRDASTNKTIKALNETAVVLSPVNPEIIINLTRQSKAKFVINYEATGKPEFRFDDTKGSVIFEDSKYEVIIADSTIKFIVKNISIADHGNYTMHAVSHGRDYKTPLRLEVHATPTVTIDEIYMEIGKDAEAVCHVSAFPPATITWSFSSCENSSDSLWQETKNETQTKLSETTQTSTIIIPASLNVTKVRCSAANFGINEAEKKVKLIDLSRPFALSQLGIDDKIADGDKVQLQCGANKHDFSNNFVWRHNGSEIKSKISDTSTGFSWRRILTIENITRHDSGLYECEVEYQNATKTEKLEITIEVNSSKAPTVTSPSKSASMNLSLGDVFKAECFAFGLPQPTIEWLKDDKAFFDSRISSKGNHSTLTITSISTKDVGTYTCKAVNRVGSFQLSFPLIITPNITAGAVDWIKYTFSSFKPFFLLAIAVYLALAVLVIGLCLKIRRERKVFAMLKAAGLANFEGGNLECFDPEVNLNEQAELLPYDKNFEFPREKLKFTKQLGAGAFGIVMQATAQGIVADQLETTVAVKTVRKQTDDEVVRALALELKIMTHMGKHLNVVNLLGAVTSNITKRELMVIVEYCKFGSVKNFLAQHREYFIDQISDGKISYTIGETVLVGSNYYKNIEGYQYTNINDGSLKTLSKQQRSVCTTDLVSWAIQVARGMDYLASKKILHGDLAARNVLLAEGNIVKICDFGLSRSLYQEVNYKKESKVPLPFKWLALESLMDQVFSTPSDVWSFGIFLWEMFSLGISPYPGMEAGRELFDLLQHGYRMDKPYLCTESIYEIMLNCWDIEPKQRPSFKELAECFESILSDAVRNNQTDSHEPHMIVHNMDYQGSLPAFDLR